MVILSVEGVSCFDCRDAHVQESTFWILKLALAIAWDVRIVSERDQALQLAFCVLNIFRNNEKYQKLPTHNFVLCHRVKLAVVLPTLA